MRLFYGRSSIKQRSNSPKIIRRLTSQVTAVTFTMPSSIDSINYPAIYQITSSRWNKLSFSVTRKRSRRVGSAARRTKDGYGSGTKSETLPERRGSRREESQRQSERERERERHVEAGNACCYADETCGSPGTVPGLHV